MRMRMRAMCDGDSERVYRLGLDLGHVPLVQRLVEGGGAIEGILPCAVGDEDTHTHTRLAREI